MSKPRPTLQEVISRIRAAGFSGIADDALRLIEALSSNPQPSLDEHELAALIKETKQSLKMTDCYRIALAVQAAQIGRKRK